MIEPLSKPPLLPSQRIRIQRFGALAEAPSIYVFADVIDELMLQARYRRDPCAAMLTGGFYSGPAGLYIEVQGFSESVYLDTTRELISVFARRHKPLREELAETRSQRILGWSHGLAGCEGALTQEALRVHLTFFNLPFQIVLMLDPDSGKLGIYRRGASGRMENVGFNLIAAAAQPEPVTAQEPEPTDDLEGGWMEMSSEDDGWLETPGELGSLPSLELGAEAPSPKEPLQEEPLQEELLQETPPEDVPGEAHEPHQPAAKEEDHEQD